MQSIKTFKETAWEEFLADGWETTRTFPENIDNEINEWLARTNSRLMHVVLHTEPVYAVERQTPDGPERRVQITRYVVSYENKDTLVEGNPVPPLQDGIAPTVEVMLVEDNVSKSAQAMAGIFGVPEGYRMHPEDVEAATPPLFSPDLDLSKYNQLFGNIVHEQR